jgi:hypothetical protein
VQRNAGGVQIVTPVAERIAATPCGHPPKPMLPHDKPGKHHHG